MRIRMHMCKATGSSHDAPVSQPFFQTCFGLCYFTNFLQWDLKERTRQEDEPSQELQEIRDKRTRLSKWMVGGEKTQQTQPVESAPTQPLEEAGNNHKII